MLRALCESTSCPVFRLHRRNTGRFSTVLENRSNQSSRRRATVTVQGVGQQAEIAMGEDTGYFPSSSSALLWFNS